MLQESFLVQLPVLSGKGLLLAALLKSTGFHLWEAIRISAEQIALSLQTAEEIQVIRLDGINCNSKQPLNIQLVCEDLQNTSFPPQLPFWTLENSVSSWRPVYRIKKESDEIKHYQFPTSLQGNLLNKILEDNNQWTIPHNTEKGYQKKNQIQKFFPNFCSLLPSLHVSDAGCMSFAQLSNTRFSSILLFWQGDCCEQIQTGPSIPQLFWHVW